MLLSPPLALFPCFPVLRIPAASCFCCVSLVPTATAPLHTCAVQGELELVQQAARLDRVGERPEQQAPAFIFPLLLVVTWQLPGICSEPRTQVVGTGFFLCASFLCPMLQVPKAPLHGRVPVGHWESTLPSLSWATLLSEYNLES